MQTNLERLRTYELELQSQEEIVDVKFFPGSDSEMSSEALAGDVLSLLQGGELAQDVSEETI